VLPEPLHPAVVHLPIALALLMPLFATALMAVIVKGAAPARAWGVAVALQVLLVGFAWLAVETGEADEERVEKVVTEQHIHEHEEAAEWFLRVAAAAALLMAAGLLPDRRGHIGRIAGVLASLAVLAAAVRTGHLGGELVYRHGAANAYTTSAPPAP
jgi:uncharacterized membrane protein